LIKCLVTVSYMYVSKIFVIQGVTENFENLLWPNGYIKTQFLTEHFLTHQVFFLHVFSIATSGYALDIQMILNLAQSLPKKVTCTRAMALTILSWSSWRSTGMGGIHIIFHESPKSEIYGCQIGWSGWPWNAAAMTYPSSCELWQLGSGFCDPQMIRLWRFTVPYKWKVALSLKTIWSKNKSYSLRQFSISVQKFLRCGWSLGFNSCRSWNLYGWKDSLICSTLHTVMWEISPISQLDRRTWNKHSRKDG
jgi:hypothetical protein